jgi:hypothetical protein
MRLLSARLTTLLLAASVTLTLFAVEVGFRAFQYVTLAGRLAQMVDRQTPVQPNSRFRPDSKAGYLYAPNFEGQLGHPWHSQWRTNSHGHVARSDYPKAKPASEFRIAALGDSMTANINNTVRWTELLEDQLNASEAWAQRTAGKTTRVINFAVDGMGLVQFAAMVRHHVPKFEPDMVIVNYIADDVLRRMRYLFTPGTGSRTQAIRSYVQSHFLDRIDWLSWRSEVIAATVLGQRWGMTSQLPFDARLILAAAPSIKFTDRQEALRAARSAVASILSQYPQALFLHMPCYYELAEELPATLKGLSAEFREAVLPLGVNIFSLQPQMSVLLAGKRTTDYPDLAGLSQRQVLALPKDRWPELFRWFFLPDDLHYTDYALGLYANEVAKVLTATPTARGQ